MEIFEGRQIPAQPGEAFKSMRHAGWRSVEERKLRETTGLQLDSKEQRRDTCKCKVITKKDFSWTNKVVGKADRA